MLIGFALGQRLLQDRLSALAALDMLREKNACDLARVSELANTDPLTNVKTRALYEIAAESIDKMIRSGSADDFAIVVCDVNGLKYTNDNFGHSYGDMLLQNSCREICHVFAHSPVFRIGGDEFAVILTGEDYDDRANLLEKLKQRSFGPPPMASFAYGCSVYRKDIDENVRMVFERADALMYEDKKQRRLVRA